MLDVSRLLPESVQGYRGPKGPWYFLIAITLISTARSLVHMLAPDGGAGSIAGIAIDGPGGSNLVAIFAQWGNSQLMLASVFWLVVLRYRALVPLMLLLIVLEQVLRLLMGQLKPIVAAGTPPGAIGSELLLPVAAVMLLWSLKRERA
jgi:hypothetical protein